MNTDKQRYKSIFSNVERCFPIRKTSVSICVCLWLVALGFFSVSAQVRPIYDRGATGLGQMLKRLNTTASALMIGAHPDDEDTALLTYLARGESARTAYLSLTRGDGGQNIIGPELGEALGVIRTEELLQARRLDGAEQYFTRAYDYGFSKTLDEAKSKWDEKVILCDTVRVIRDFRPLVVISQFSGTPTDGHGQHQFAGYISPLAVKAAADPTQCTDAGIPWQVKKFYVRHGFRATGEPQLKINTGKYDPLLGRSYFEIAMEARSQHKSQEQGVLELRGDQFSGLNLVGNVTKETGVFDGIDISVAGASRDLPISAESLAEYQAALDTIQRNLNIQTPERLVPDLVRVWSILQKQAQTMRSEAGRVFIESRLKHLGEAIVMASGIQIDALADAETVVPGESIFIGAKAYLPHKETSQIKHMELVLPSGWTVSNEETPKTASSAFVAREVGSASRYFKLTVPANWQPTQPYWLKTDREGDMFRWANDDASQTQPFQQAEMKLAVTLDVQGTEIVVERPVEFRFADDIRGEIRRIVNVVPPISISLERDLLIVPRGPRRIQGNFSVRVSNNTGGELKVSLHTIKPGVGTVTTELAESEMILKARETAITNLNIGVIGEMKSPPFEIGVVAKVGSSFYSDEMKSVAYPHIQTHRYYKRAKTKVVMLDIVTERRKIGYVAGSGDRVPEAIKQMGFDIEMITERELASGNLSRFDTIVVGIRAYQVRPDVVANNTRLLDYAKNGGTLIVQYQLPPYAQNYAPFPAQQAQRVADENAKVTVLDPAHSIFNSPNKITDEDFKGWVQERNLYNFSTMDAAYTPLLESHDAGEAENKGGLVIAKVGKGNYIYCSYSMFRQLPAGVPGAYRLFANMLSLPKVGMK